MKYYSKLIVVLSASFILAGCGRVVNNDQSKSKQSIPNNTIGTFIVVDYSGSMAEAISGGIKCEIVKRNLVSVGNQMDTYLKANPNSSLYIGMILMHGGRVIIEPSLTINSNACATLEGMVNAYMSVLPDGGTPLGVAIETAWANMKNMNIRSKNIIVLTDGESNSGKKPEEFMTELRLEYTNGLPVGINFLAFDVNSSSFEGVRKMGATVVAAANEKELNEKMEYILREKILLEKED